jgi:hypothetical protein
MTFFSKKNIKSPQGKCTYQDDCQFSLSVLTRQHERPTNIMTCYPPSSTLVLEFNYFMMSEDLDVILPSYSGCSMVFQIFGHKVDGDCISVRDSLLCER